jgi:O-antigen/teichoic acid export membrane protein
VKFAINLLRNLSIVVILAVILYIIKPEIMAQVFLEYWMYFTPLLLLLAVFLAFPRKRKKQ